MNREQILEYIKEKIISGKVSIDFKSKRKQRIEKGIDIIVRYYSFRKKKLSLDIICDAGTKIGFAVLNEVFGKSERKRLPYDKNQKLNVTVRFDAQQIYLGD